MCSVCGNDETNDQYESEPGTPERVEEIRQQQLATIMEVGHQIIGIIDTDPGWFYTVGRAVFDQARPELLLTGNLPQRAAMGILNDLAAQDTEGKIDLVALAEAGVPTRVENFDCDLKFVVVDPDVCEMYQAINLAGGADKMTAIQVVWPDDEGRWPDNPDFAYGPTAEPVGHVH